MGIIGMCSVGLLLVLGNVVMFYVHNNKDEGGEEEEEEHLEINVAWFLTRSSELVIQALTFTCALAILTSITWSIALLDIGNTFNAQFETFVVAALASLIAAIIILIVGQVDACLATIKSAA